MPAGARAIAAYGRQRSSRRYAASPAPTQTVTMTGSAVGLVRPAARQTSPAATQRRQSSAYSAHAASAVNSDSVYTACSYTACGSTPHSPARIMPTRPSYTFAQILYMPAAATALATQEMIRPDLTRLSGVSQATQRISIG